MFKNLIYLVKDNATAPQNTLRMKTIEGDGKIFQAPDLVLSGQIVMIKFSSTFGIAITKDNKIYYFVLLHNQITIAKQKYLATDIVNGPQTPEDQTTDLTQWTPVKISELFLVSFIGYSFEIIFQSNESPMQFLSVLVGHSQSRVYIQFSANLPDNNINSLYSGLIYQNTERQFYSFGQPVDLNLTTYGNEKMFSMGHYELNDFFLYVSKLMVVWSFDQTEGSQKAYLNVYSLVITSSQSSAIGHIQTLQTDKFNDLSTTRFYHSTLNQHIVEYDGQHLRYSVLFNQNDLYSYTSSTNDTLQLLLAGGAALQFTFYDQIMMILTDSNKIIQVGVTQAYDTVSSQQKYIQQTDREYKVSENWMFDTDLQIYRTIQLGTDVIGWFTNLDSDFVVTKTSCTCSEKGVSHMECFQNSVCIFVATNQIFDCTDIYYERIELSM